MRVKDESEWQQFLAEVAADTDPIAPTFRDWMIAWAETAESVVDMWSENGGVDFEEVEPQYWPIRALRDTLPIVSERVGRQSVGLVGQALVLYGTYWYYAGDPDEFFDTLTTIEQNLCGDVMIAKALQLQATAQTDEEKQVAQELLYGKGPDVNSH